MKQFYGDVVVIEERRIRVSFEAAEMPSKEAMKGLLQNQDYHDITDEETYSYLEVVDVDDVKEIDPNEEEEE